MSLEKTREEVFMIYNSIITSGVVYKDELDPDFLFVEASHLHDEFQRNFDKHYEVSKKLKEQQLFTTGA